MRPFLFQAPSYTSPSGYAEFAKNLLIEFYRRGWPVRYEPVFWDNNICPIDEQKEDTILQLQAMTGNVQPEWALVLRLPDQINISPEMFIVNYTMFETDGIPNHWVDCINGRMDEVWVPSDFNVHTFARSGVRREKIRKIPLGIDLKELKKWDFAEITKSRERLELDPKLKMFMASMQGQPRKNIEGLVIPFIEQFAGCEDRMLLLKCYAYPGLDIPGWVKQIRKEVSERTKTDATKHPKIVLNTQIMSMGKVHELLAISDCYVSQSHGEGADMMALKAAAMGKPVIAPFWSGYTEYLEPSGALSTPIVTFSPAHNKNMVTDRYYKGQLWCEPDREHYKKALGMVAGGGEALALDEVNAVQERVLKNHSIAATCDAIEQAVEDAMSKPLPKVTSLRSNVGPRTLLACPSPAQPCGIWENANQLAPYLPTNVALVPGKPLVAPDLHSMFQQIENHQVDLVHLHLHFTFLPPVRLELLYRKLREYGVKIVTTLHSTSDSQNLVQSTVMRESDHVIVHHPADPGRLDVSNVSYMPLHFMPKYDGKRIGTKNTIGFFGFSFQHKGLKDWILAIESLRENDPSLVGLAIAPLHPVQNPSTVRLDQWMQRRGVKGVNLVHQFLPEPTALQMLSQCKLIVLPYKETQWKGSSAAIRFVARLGIPILVSDTGWFEEFNDAGEVFKFDDSRDLAQRMRLCLKDPRRDTVREGMAKYASVNSLEETGQAVMRIYEELLKFKTELKEVASA